MIYILDKKMSYENACFVRYSSVMENEENVVILYPNSTV